MSKEKTKVFNLKLTESVRNRFKVVTRKNHTTMQQVLAAFVESYIESPGKFKIKMEVNDKTMVSPRRVNMSSKAVEHEVEKFQNFEVRKVLGPDSIQKVFHLKPFNKKVFDGMVNFFNEKLPGCQIGLADPSGELGLDYPVFLIVEDEMQKLAIDDVFKAADLSLVS